MRYFQSFELLSGEWLARVYLILTAPALVILCFLTQPLHSSDEPAHFLRVVQLAQGGIFPVLSGDKKSTGSYEAKATRDFARYYGYESDIFAHPNSKTSLTELETLYAIKGSDKQKFIEHSNTTIYFPLAYIVPAISVATARIITNRPLIWLYVGRLTNSMAGMMITFFALRFSNRARLLIFTIATLPIVLFHTAALSADTVLIPSVLAMVVFVDRILSGVVLSTKQVMFGTGAAALVGLGKIAYLPLVGVIPLVAWLANRRLNRFQYQIIIGTLAIVIVWACWSLAIRGLIFTTRVPNPGTIDVNRQIILVAAHPMIFLKALSETLTVDNLRSYYQSFVGARLGWFEKAPRGAASLSGTMLLLFLFVDIVKRRTPLGGFLVIYGAALISVLAVFFLLYLQWNPVGARSIDGVQGRYFLPVLPLVAIVTPSLTLRGRVLSWLPFVVLAWGLFAVSITIYFDLNRYWVVT